MTQTIKMNRQYSRIAEKASRPPNRMTCSRFDITMGRINAATAINGSRNNDNPEIITNGIAKPTDPLTNPATKVTPKAATNAHKGIRSKVDCSMDETPDCALLDEAHARCTAKNVTTFSCVT